MTADEDDSDDGGSLKKELVKSGVEVIKTVYDDALQPIAKETGKALGTIGETVNMALSPVRVLVWSWKQIEDYVSSTVEDKLQARKVPKERIITPDPDIAVPALEALRYSKLHDNFANLLATSMDSATANEAHPSYVEILKQLTPDEAKLLAFLPNLGSYEPIAELAYTSPEKADHTLARCVSNLGVDAGCEFLDAVPKYVDNMCRLGLTEIPSMIQLAEEFRYDRIRQLDIVRAYESQIPNGSTFQFVPKMFGLTDLGSSFRFACIENPESA